MKGERGWPCANCGGQGGHYYQGEPVPGACVPSGLPVSLHETQPLSGNDWVPKEMWELVEGGGEATMEELVKKWDEELGEEEEEQVQ